MPTSKNKPGKCSYVSEAGYQCQTRPFRLGLCQKHYYRHYRGRDMDRVRVLTEDQMREIERSNRATGQLAQQMGCSESRIRQIRAAYRLEHENAARQRRR